MALTTRPETSWGATSLAAGLVGGAGLVAIWCITLGFQGWTSETLRRERVRESPPLLARVALRSNTGSVIVPWDGAEPAHRFYLVTFIYTRCPTLCSTAGAQLQGVQRQLSGDLANRIQLLSISFDSLNDDEAALRRYAADHAAEPSRWQVAIPTTGTALAALLREAGVVVISDGRGGFTHNAAIHLVRADGRLLGIYDLDQGDQALADARGWAE
jgi:protein SCO1/2